MRALLIILALWFAWTDLAYGWSSRASRTQYDITDLNFAVDSFRSEFGRYPSAEEFSGELIRAKLLDQGRDPLMDRWNQPFQYRFPGQHGDFDVYSVGENGIDDAGERDDITNWRDINEGYYWKSLWPGGRSMIRWGKIIGLGALLLGFCFPMRLIVPFSWAIIAFGYMVGSQMLLHPGHVPSHNDPLIFRIATAGLVLLFLLAVFTLNFRRHILQKTTSPSASESEAHAQA